MPLAPGGARHGGGNRAMTSQPRTGQSASYGGLKSSYGGAGGWDRSGCAKGAPRCANRKGEEQHRHTECGSHTRRDKGRQGGGAQQGRRGNQNSGNREPEWKGWESVQDNWDQRSFKKQREMHMKTQKHMATQCSHFGGGKKTGGFNKPTPCSACQNLPSRGTPSLFHPHGSSQPPSRKGGTGNSRPLDTLALRSSPTAAFHGCPLRCIGHTCASVW